MPTQNDAIQQDAPEQVETQIKEQLEAAEVADPRMSALEALAATREAAMLKDNGIEPEAEEDAPDEKKDEEAKQEPKAELDEKKEEAQPERIKVKVDGEEMELTLEELKRGFQKESTASKRLQEAATRKAELDAREAKLNEQLASAQAKPVEEETKEEPQVKEFLEAMYSGDQDKAEQLFTKLFREGRQQTTQAPEIDLGQIIPAVKQQLAVDSAWSKFQDDYKDIVDDPYLSNIAGAFLKEELDGGAQMDMALKASGDKTRDWLKAKTGTPTTTTTLSDRAGKKETLNVVKTSTNASAAHAVPAAETTADVIAEMRKQRGQSA